MSDYILEKCSLTFFFPSIGIGYSTGGQQNGFTLELGASVGRGNANGRDESWTNSNITAGNVLAMQSGGDTTL
ncbi:hypothetical protein CEY09_31660, partial [Achromobacter marplatensis]